MPRHNSRRPIPFGHSFTSHTMRIMRSYRLSATACSPRDPPRLHAAPHLGRSPREPPQLHNKTLTKHHPPTHHRAVRPICTHQAEHSPTTMQGCVNMLKGLAATRHKSPADEPKPGETAASLPSLHASLREMASLPSLRSSPHGEEARKPHYRDNPLHIKQLASRVSRVHAITRKC